MSKGKCLGLVGGLGVGATIHYYKKLAEAHQAQERTMDCVITHAETSRVFEYVKAANPTGLAEYLNSFLLRLKAAGAEVGVIPAVTPQYALRELLAISALPLISMTEPLAAELASRGVRRVAVFGTRYSVESGFFGLLDNVEFVCPQPAEVDLIHTTYEEVVRDACGSEPQRRSLTALANTLQQRDGVDAILIAGTDFTLLFNEENTDFPHVDCAAVHIGAIAKHLLD